MAAPVRTVVTGAVLVLAGVGCGHEEPPSVPYGPWKGSVSVEGGTTFVRNVSGAIWSRPARLEQELSIGVAEGAEENMLGHVTGVATDGQRIVVVDASVPVLRVFDATGRYLDSWGRAGDGPGELRTPMSVDRDARGRIYVLDQSRYRIVVYGPEGRFLHELVLPGGSMTNQPIVVADGRAWWHQAIDRDRPGFLGWGYRGYSEHAEPVERRGPVLDFEPDLLLGPGPPCVALPVPYTPQYSSVMLSDGSVAAGSGESYRIVIEGADGGRRVVERTWRPVPIAAEQRAWGRRYEHAFNVHACGISWTWNGPDLPGSYPAFHELIATQSGELWVVRQTGAERIPDSECDAEPELDGSRPGPACWPDRDAVDAFDGEGRYRGEVILPEDLPWSELRSAWIEGDTVIAPVTDAAGVIHVRKYRLVAD